MNKYHDSTYLCAICKGFRTPMLDEESILREYDWYL